MEKSDLRSSRFAQAILDILIPFASLAVTILFGIYSIKSVQLAQDANKMSSNANKAANSANSISNDDGRTSNILGLLQICLGDTTVRLNSVFNANANRVLIQALPPASRNACASFVTNAPVPSIVSALGPSSTQSIDSETSSSGSKAAVDGVIIGVVVGIVAAGILVGVLVWLSRRGRRYALSSDQAVQEK